MLRALNRTDKNAFSRLANSRGDVQSRRAKRWVQCAYFGHFMASGTSAVPFWNSATMAAFRSTMT
jgi:hypothetical protein